MANIKVIDTLPLDKKLVARQAIYGSLQTVWIMVSSSLWYKERMLTHLCSTLHLQLWG